MRSYMSLPWVLGVLAILSLVAVACGTSAPSEPVIVEKEVLKEVPVEVLKEVVVTATPKPVQDSEQVTAKVDRVIFVI